MISFIVFNRRYKLRYGHIFCYAISLVILLVGFHIRSLRRSFEEGEELDAKRVAAWQRISVLVPCHLAREGNGLEILRDDATLPENSIFFHETSCRGDLTSRQACAVESAAKAHPDHQINVFFTSAVSEVTLKNGCISALYHYKNVKIARVLVSDYAKGTPVESKVSKLASEQLNAHISDIMKFLSLYKYGGIYLSLDVIVARRLDLWKNWAVKEAPKSLSSDMFAISKNKAGRRMAQEALTILLSELEMRKQDLWSYSGPSVISYLLAYWCSTQDVQIMSISKCKDLAVHGPELFFPISFHDRQQYFRVVNWEHWKKKLIFTYFIWQRFTKYNVVTPGTLFGMIAKEYCPETYNHYSDRFGVWYPDHFDNEDTRVN